MNINNGRRAVVTFDGYSGVGGLTESDGKASLALPGAASALRAGMTVVADGRQWIVEKIGPSQFVRGFKLAELRPAEGA